MTFAETPVDSMIFRGHTLFVKRDDLLHPQFSGNKARKFAYFLDTDFSDITHLIGFGSAQANSLYSLAALAKLKGWQLDYYVDHVSETVKHHCLGNYGAALALGANIIEKPSENLEAYLETYVVPTAKNTLYVPEGGRCQFAQYGVDRLAAEIVIWAKRNQLRALKVFLPSGTGTTALYLSRYFVEHNRLNQLDIQVVTCAVVGDDDYLRRQFVQLGQAIEYHPIILPTPKKIHFGKLNLACYQMWLELEQSGISFELLYDPVGFMTLAAHMECLAMTPILYLHQGGLLGNQTMLPRYQRKYPQYSNGQ